MSRPGSASRKPAWLPEGPPGAVGAASTDEGPAAQAAGHGHPDGKRARLVRANFSGNRAPRPLYCSAIAADSAHDCAAVGPAGPLQSGKTTAVAQCNACLAECNPQCRVIHESDDHQTTPRPQTARLDTLADISAERSDRSARSAKPQVDQHRQDDADQEAGGEREVEGEILPLPGKIAGKATQPEPLTRVQHRAEQQQAGPDHHQQLWQRTHAKPADPEFRTPAANVGTNASARKPS
jgi:hypothetical protein